MSKNNDLKSMQELLTRPGTSHTVLLTSFRRNGHGVGTPVSMMSAGGQAYFIRQEHQKYLLGSTQ